MSFPSSRQTHDAPHGRRTLWAAAGLAVLLIAFFWFRAARPTDSGTAKTIAAPADPVAPVAGGASLAAGAPKEAWHEPEPRTGVDGSHFYKEAFQLYGRLSDEEKKMISRPKEEVDADKAAELFEKLKPLMALLHQGAQADYCDWALGPISLDSGLPQLGKAMELGNASRWFAAYRFPTEPEAAVRDLAARARLGHDISDLLVGLLVSTSFETSAVELLRQNVAHFTPATFVSAQELLTVSSLSEDTARAFASEASAQEMYAKKIATSTPEEREGLLGTVASSPEEHSRLKHLKEPDVLQAELLYAAKLTRQLAEAFPLPEAHYRHVKQQIEATLADHPLAAAIVPTYDGVRTRLQRSEVEREMLKAGLDLLQSAAIPGHTRDPNSGQPFVYLPTENGFTLQSTFKVKGKPVTMSFPQMK